MAKRGGFPGGMGMPGNMNNLMKQAQKMQRQMEEGQKELYPVRKKFLKYSFLRKLLTRMILKCFRI